MFHCICQLNAWVYISHCLTMCLRSAVNAGNLIYSLPFYCKVVRFHDMYINKFRQLTYFLKINKRSTNIGLLAIHNRFECNVGLFWSKILRWIYFVVSSETSKSIPLLHHHASTTWLLKSACLRRNCLDTWRSVCLYWSATMTFASLLHVTPIHAPIARF